MTCDSVDLPEPFGPMIACTSPLITVSDSPWRISRSSTRTCKFLTSSNAVIFFPSGLQRPQNGRQHQPSKKSKSSKTGRHFAEFHYINPSGQGANQGEESSSDCHKQCDRKRHDLDEAEDSLEHGLTRRCPPARSRSASAPRPRTPSAAAAARP